jgi:hypothetical protein
MLSVYMPALEECSNCGYRYPGGTVRCPKCGDLNIKSSAGATSKKSDKTVHSDAGRPTQTKSKKSSPWKVLLAMAVSGLVIVIIIILSINKHFLIPGIQSPQNINRTKNTQIRHGNGFQSSFGLKDESQEPLNADIESQNNSEESTEGTESDKTGLNLSEGNSNIVSGRTTAGKAAVQKYVQTSGNSRSNNIIEALKAALPHDIVRYTSMRITQSKQNPQLHQIDITFPDRDFDTGIIFMQLASVVGKHIQQYNYQAEVLTIKHGHQSYFVKPETCTQLWRISKDMELTPYEANRIWESMRR